MLLGSYQHNEPERNDEESSVETERRSHRCCVTVLLKSGIVLPSFQGQRKTVPLSFSLKSALIWRISSLMKVPLMFCSILPQPQSYVLSDVA